MAKSQSVLAPRNAYEQAASLLAEIQRDAAKLEDGEKLVKRLDELWRLFELCIPDADKLSKAK